MIHQLTVRNPKRTPIAHWAQVPFLQGVDSIQFKPGLNVVFGDNGSGKSTLINALATLLHCRQENWPRVCPASLMAFNRPGGFTTGLLLEHDGSPARFLGTEAVAMAPDAKHVRETTVTLDVRRLEVKALDRMSAGQASLTRLVRFLRAEPKKVRVSVKDKAALAPEMQNLYAVATESLFNVTKRPGPRQPVILLDEADISMDFAKQAVVWKTIRQIAHHSQVIVASHSPFAVNAPGAHYIETAPNYLANAREGLRALLQMSA